MYVCMYIYIYIYILENHRANARKRNPSCSVEPELTKAFRGVLIQMCTSGGIQYEEPYCIGVSGNYRASSERFPKEKPFVQCPTRAD